MKPVSPLMIEHRLIERMVKLLSRELQMMRDAGKADTKFISDGVDFFRTYADRTHHGKEEDILFKELATKTLAKEYEEMMQRLIQEHIWARQAVRKLSESNGRFAQGDRVSLPAMIHELAKIVEFYPVHIEREDRHFFIPIMVYFSAAEQQAMLEKFWEFDRTMIHTRYGEVVAEYEKMHRHM